MADNFSLFSWKRSEAVFVIVVLLCILSVSWWQLKDSQAKTRDAQRKADAELIARALVIYYEDHGYYPPATTDGQLVSCGRAGGDVCTWGESAVVDGDEVAYINKLPQDPFTARGQKYVYIPDNSLANFKIYVALERTADPDSRPDLTIECGNALQCNWYVEN